MSDQTISTEFWQARLPADWLRLEQGLKASVYFESPDGTAGAYFLTVRTTRQAIAAIAEMRAIEWRAFSREDPEEWEILSQSETVNGTVVDAVTVYFNRRDRYRIVSRMLGRDERYIRFTYHDYDCAELSESAKRSRPWLESLELRGEKAERRDD